MTERYKRIMEDRAQFFFGWVTAELGCYFLFRGKVPDPLMAITTVIGAYLVMAVIDRMIGRHRS